MKDAIGILFIVYCFAAGAAIPLGVLENFITWRGCVRYEEASRLRRMFPTFEVGCWLGRVP